MNTKPNLPKPVMSRINRLAHLRALQYEARVKAELVAKLLAARGKGDAFEDYASLLNRLEAAQPAG